MVVISLKFLLFFVIVFVVYYLPASRISSKYQNIWLFLTSYLFYGLADWKMIPLLFGATIVFYCIGLWLQFELGKGHVKNASYITTLGVALGVGVLFYFKYLNFFAESFARLLNAIGFHVSWNTLNVVLPIGVSFFTFKLISYIIEIHREHIKPCKDFIEFGTYIAFFPTILSGPIDKPNKFIPQLGNVRFFDYGLAVDGCRQILWGMFTKMCISDNLAPITDTIWQEYENFSASTLLMIIILYPIQMYADFDGYSNMAIGVGKLLGIRITNNFKHPFLARNIAEYWRNWHISLTGWLTEYVFSPLNIAFRNLQNWGIVLAIIINFVIIGLWHGANWTFAMFGLYHGLLYIPLIVSGSFGKNKKLRPNKYGLPKGKDAFKMIGTFMLVAIGLVLFKSPSLGVAYDFMSSLANISIFDLSTGYEELEALEFQPYTFLFVILLLLSEWTCRNRQHNLELREESFLSGHIFMRRSLYVFIITLLLMCKGVGMQFIYFQF